MINNGQFKKGCKSYFKGKKRPEISGEKHPRWKGGKNNYPKCWCGKRLSRIDAKNCKIHPSKEHKEKLSLAKKEIYRDDNHPQWKGDKAGYRAKHLWIERKLGKPMKCKKCGVEGIGHKIQWANKSHKYKRKISDWIRLCAKCHGIFDLGRRSKTKS